MEPFNPRAEAENLSLAQELVQLAQADQEMRRKVQSGQAEWDSSVNELSQARLREIVRQKGWPTISSVGAEASHAAWLLIQHAPSLEFMEECLALMKKLPTGEIKPANIAYLEDRVLMMNGKPQVYGTQFQGEDEKLRIWPIQDPERVDERRASIGLGKLAEDEAEIRECYGPKPK